MPPPYDTNKLIEESKALVSQTQAQGATPYAGSSFQVAPVAQPITSSALSSAQPLTPEVETPIPPPIVSPYAITPEEKQAETQQVDVSSRIADLTAQLDPSFQRQSRLNQETTQDVLGKTNTVRGFQNKATQLQAEAQGINLQRQQILEQNRAQGGSSFQLSANDQATNRQFNQQLLTNAISQYTNNASLAASQGDLSSALDFVDRAVEAEFLPKEQQLAREEANLKKLQASGLLTSAQEKRAEARQAQIDADKEAVATEKQNRLEVNKLALEAARNGADALTLDRIRKSKTPDEAIVAGGEVFADPERGLKMELLKEQIATQRQNRSNSQVDRLIEMAKLGDASAMKQLGITPPTPGSKVAVTQKEAAALNQQITQNDNYKAIDKSISSWRALGEYEKLVNDVGATNRIVDPLDTGKSRAVWNTALLNLKEYYNLGVLNGPDLDIMQQLVPSNVKGVLGSVNLVGGFVSDYITKRKVLDAIANQKVQFEDKLDTDYLSVRNQYKDYSPDQLTNLQDLDRKYLQMKATINPAIQTFLDENPSLTLEEKLQVINTRL